MLANRTARSPTQPILPAMAILLYCSLLGSGCSGNNSNGPDQ
jgi:hypothetical protein